jgi:hypothetical protein
MTFYLKRLQNNINLNLEKWNSSTCLKVLPSRVIFDHLVHFSWRILSNPNDNVQYMEKQVLRF